MQHVKQEIEGRVSKSIALLEAVRSDVMNLTLSVDRVNKILLALDDVLRAVEFAEEGVWDDPV